MGRRLPHDWYDGEIPDNVVLEDGSSVESAFAFSRFRARAADALVARHGSSIYGGSVLDVGPEGRVVIGRYALLNSVRVICDASVEIGAFALISWNVVIMDAHRRPGTRPAPVRLGPNVWIGFDSVVLPGVTIGAGSIVGARSVVTEPVPPFTIVAGNPARVIRALDPSEVGHGPHAR